MTLEDCIAYMDAELAAHTKVDDFHTLREELATLRKDAERYRKMRDPHMSETGDTLNVMAMALRRAHPYTMAMSGNALDELLDSITAPE